MIKHIIWDSNPDFEDWREGLEEEYPNLSEDELRDKMYFLTECDFEDEKINLNIDLPQSIIAIADLGFWYGNRCGYRELGYNLSDCLSVCLDKLQQYYVNEFGDICCRGVGHDGISHYVFRMYRRNVTDRQIKNLQDKIYNGTVCWDDIAKVTRRIGDYAAKVHGWKIVGGIHL